MADYQLTNSSKASIDDIYEYSILTFGLKQASEYVLGDKCHDIVDNFLCHDIVDNAFEQLCYDWNRYDECPSRIWRYV